MCCEEQGINLWLYRKELALCLPSKVVEGFALLHLLLPPAPSIPSLTYHLLVCISLFNPWLP